MEDCSDEDSGKEPVNRCLQPTSYATALSKFSSHSEPVRTEDFLQDLGLSMPEVLRNTYKLCTSVVGGNCFFSALSQQPPFVNNQSALELKLAI